MKKSYIIILLIFNLILLIYSDINKIEFFNEIKNEVKINTNKLEKILKTTKDYDGPNLKDGFNNDKLENLIENTEYVKTTDFSMQTYFANLQKYLPSNPVGSCGYVAIASALSYYDNFYNDDIIPEKYEFYDNTSSLEEAKKISPGLYKGFKLKDKKGFYDYVKISTDYDFQSYLINMYKTQKNDETLEFGLNVKDYKELIELYFKENPQLKPKYKHFYVSEDLEKIKDILKTNNPVLLGAKSKNPDNQFMHRFIAYGIADDGDILINTGWSNNKYKNYKLS